VKKKRAIVCFTRQGKELSENLKTGISAIAPEGSADRQVFFRVDK
jgi:hypothetical protein